MCHLAGLGTRPYWPCTLPPARLGEGSPFWKQFAGRSVVPLADFGGLLDQWRQVATLLTVPEVFDRILADVGYKDHIDDGTEEGKDRWDNVLELRRLAEEYATRRLPEFLENVALVSDQDTIREGNVPTLLTLHAAKGLEFGVVFIAGLDDGILPHSRSFDEPEEMEEERRLFYVGITRAKDRLFFVRAMRRGGRGYGEETVESRFLEDIPEALISGKARAGGSRTARRSLASSWSLPAPSRPAPVVEAQFRPGMRVKHPVWGEGMVLDSRIQDDDELVDAVFESVGIKRLAASLANLKIVA
jgi:DNA helicase-2/ATP-dependent DNA helicase PcrA